MMRDLVWSEIHRRIRNAAINGTRLHLEIEHARALATNPELQALLGRLIAGEIADFLAAADAAADLGLPPPGRES